MMEGNDNWSWVMMMMMMMMMMMLILASVWMLFYTVSPPDLYRS